MLLLLWIGGGLVFVAAVKSTDRNSAAHGSGVQNADSGTADSETSETKALLEKTGAVVVLTGGRDRIKIGLRLFAEGKAPALFISGVNPNVPESTIRAMWEGDAPLPDCCLDLGRSAANTMNNAQETRRWLADKDIHSIRLVTSRYHMPRALMEFRHEMPEIRIIAHPVLAEKEIKDAAGLRLHMLREYNKTILTWLRMRLPFPAGWPFSEKDSESAAARPQHLHQETQEAPGGPA